MEKINFENGTLVSPAIVNEDNTITPAVWEGNTPISAYMLNLLQSNVEESINAKTTEMGKLMHPVGSIYMSTSNTNPNSILGFGQWELVRNYHGGELLSAGTVWTNEAGTLIPTNTSASFADSSVGGEQTSSINDFGLDILKHEFGTINVYTRNIVGFVEAEVIVTGYANTGNVALWWAGNKNALPEGVELMQSEGVMTIAKCSNEHEYGSATNSLYYKILTNENVSFYVNPQFTVYSGDFTPGQGGVRCILKVKAYAKGGTNYMWRRTA